MMKQTFSAARYDGICDKLGNPESRIQNPKSKEPVHVVYGGAHLFTSETPQKLGKIALKSLNEYAPDVETFAEIFGIRSEIAAHVFKRVTRKLATQAVEDFRIDFEDGYGFRRDDEENLHAIAASGELAKSFADGVITPFCGFRIKSFQPETARRAVQTLDLFLTNLLDKTAGKLPENFVVTLPKVENADQIEVLAELLNEFENAARLPENSIKIEILIETPTAIFSERGELNLRKLIEAAENRIVAAHFGAYDFTSAFGITAEYQDLKHPLCDAARDLMQIALAPTGVRLSDSVTTLMPIAVHRGDNLSAAHIEENRQAVITAWREHFQNVTRSLANGFYQSWDLHPAQLPARYAAVYSFFYNSLDSSAKRLCGFLDKATQALTTGNQFDDAASANGLVNFFNRALNCGALTEDEILEKTNLSLAEIKTKFNRR